MQVEDEGEPEAARLCLDGRPSCWNRLGHRLQPASTTTETVRGPELLLSVMMVDVEDARGGDHAVRGASVSYAGVNHESYWGQEERVNGCGLPNGTLARQ